MEQRLRALERENVVLHDTVKMLHEMLKEQRKVISDYVTMKMSNSNGHNGDKGHNGDNGRSCDELYSFVCKQRLDRTDKDVDRVRKSIEALRLKAS